MFDSILGDIFDLNNDGIIDELELGAELMAISSTIDDGVESKEDIYDYECIDESDKDLDNYF